MRSGQLFVLLSIVILIVVLLVNKLLLKNDWGISIRRSIFTALGFSLLDRALYRFFEVDIIALFELLIRR